MVASRRNGKRTHHEWRKAISVDGLALRNSHSTEGSSMIRTLHRDDILLASDTAHHLERSLNSFGARIYEEERVERRVWHDWKQTFYKAQIRLMVCDATLNAVQGGEE
jgi:hypothetical protein